MNGRSIEGRAGCKGTCVRNRRIYRQDPRARGLPKHSHRSENRLGCRSASKGKSARAVYCTWLDDSTLTFPQFIVEQPFAAARSSRARDTSSPARSPTTTISPLRSVSVLRSDIAVTIARRQPPCFQPQKGDAGVPDRITCCNQSLDYLCPLRLYYNFLELIRGLHSMQTSLRALARHHVSKSLSRHPIAYQNQKSVIAEPASGHRVRLMEFQAEKGETAALCGPDFAADPEDGA